MHAFLNTLTNMKWSHPYWCSKGNMWKIKGISHPYLLVSSVTDVSLVKWSFFIPLSHPPISPLSFISPNTWVSPHLFLFLFPILSSAMFALKRSFVLGLSEVICSVWIYFTLQERLWYWSYRLFAAFSSMCLPTCDLCSDWFTWIKGWKKIQRCIIKEKTFSPFLSPWSARSQVHLS